MEIPDKQKDSYPIFEKTIGAIAWLQIVVSPVLIGIGIAAGLYALFPHPITAFISIAIIIMAFVIGAVWATKVARKSGTINFIARASSSETFETPKEKIEK